MTNFQDYASARCFKCLKKLFNILNFFPLNETLVDFNRKIIKFLTDFGFCSKNVFFLQNF